MSFHVAIDPGKSAGVAVFFQHAEADVKSRRLVGAYLMDPECPADIDRHLLVREKARTVTVEIPIVYTGPRSKVNPNDLIRLAVRAGKLAGFGSEEVKPVEWKGNVPDDVLYKRVLKSLGEDETRVLEMHLEKVAKSKRHNVLDAVGIGLYKARRFGRGIVPGSPD